MPLLCGLGQVSSLGLGFLICELMVVLGGGLLGHYSCPFQTWTHLWICLCLTGKRCEGRRHVSPYRLVCHTAPNRGPAASLDRWRLWHQSEGASSFQNPRPMRETSWALTFAAAHFLANPICSPVQLSPQASNSRKAYPQPAAIPLFEGKGGTPDHSNIWLRVSGGLEERLRSLDSLCPLWIYLIF